MSDYIYSGPSSCSYTYELEKKIPEYFVIHEYQLRRLEAKVNEMLAVGWEPQGGVSLTSSDHYVQAMIRR